jgi:FKBP-type peptidyl-prolyl cis-trans isomerase FkpA
MNIRLIHCFIVGCLVTTAVGCKDELKFKKTKGPLEYAIVRSNSGGDTIGYGNVIQFTAYSYYNDSILATPFDTIVQLQPVDSTQIPPELIQMFREARVGDSLITRMLVDSARKYGPLPEFYKSGKYIGYRIKVRGVIRDSAQAEFEKQKMILTMTRVDSLNKAQMGAKEDKALAERVAKDGVQAIKTPKGTYVYIMNPGQGMQVDSGKVVTVDYKGMTLDGNVFDQSYNAAGVSERPYTFAAGQPGVIPGFDDGLRLLKKGGKARLYIPSRLAYGQQGASNIKPNSSLIFEVEVRDVVTQAEGKMKLKKQEDEAMRRQQVFMDSVRKAQK